MSLRALLLGIWISSATLVYAADLSPAARRLDTCRTCHGAQGEGNPLLAAPALAGQREEYLVRQLHNFKSGKRGYHRDDRHGNTMRGIASTLSDDEITALAKHFATLAVAPAGAAIKGDVAAGKARYLGTCAMCHGEKAEGYLPLQSPSLRVLNSEYLSAQMHSFVKGWRGDASEFDQPSLWMRSIAAQVSDPVELANIIAYIKSLR